MAYIDNQDYFDIICSKKIGYVMIPAQYPDEAGVDVIASPENKSHTAGSNKLTAWEEAESRRRIAAILETMEDKDAYLHFQDSYLKEYQERYEEDNWL